MASISYANIWHCIKNTTTHVGLDKKDIPEVCLILKEKHGEDVMTTYYLALHTEDTKNKRLEVYDDLIENISSDLKPEILEDYVAHMEGMSTDDRFIYITKLQKMNKAEKLRYFNRTFGL